jgi:hypothetical protein
MPKGTQAEPSNIGKRPIATRFIKTPPHKWKDDLLIKKRKIRTKINADEMLKRIHLKNIEAAKEKMRRDDEKKKKEKKHNRLSKLAIPSKK